MHNHNERIAEVCKKCYAITAQSTHTQRQQSNRHEVPNHMRVATWVIMSPRGPFRYGQGVVLFWAEDSESFDKITLLHGPPKERSPAAPRAPWKRQWSEGPVV